MSALVDTFAPFPIDIVSGHGSQLRSRDNRWYWDFYGGHAVALLGQAHPAMVDAVSKQMASLSFYSNVLTLDVRTRAANQLCAFAPKGINNVFFCNSGAEANENAIKLALQHTCRTRIASLCGGWHGRTILCLSATDDPKITTPFEPFLCKVVRLRPNVLADLERIDETTAAIILEPIQSIAGIVELTPEYLRAVRRRCDESGTILIYDEVQTGMGRLGTPFAAGQYDVTPDIMTLAKGIAGGIPMGALLLNERVKSRIKVGDLGSTFGGGPVACAALLAVLDTIQRDNLLVHARQLGNRMRERLPVGPVACVLGRGCLVGLRVRTEARLLHRKLMDLGFLTGTSHDPHVLRLMPAINLPFEAVDELAAALVQIGNTE